MNIPYTRVFFAVFLLFLSSSAFVSAQEKEVFKKKGLTLTFMNEDKEFSPAVRTKLIETFFEVYPVLKKEYNPKAAKEITFVIDTTYKGVAATTGTVVSFSPAYFHKHPGDVDVVTHEVMHIVQAYGDSVGPWYLTEGIADYVRYTYGVENAGAKWTLPDYKEGQKYENGYRVTARFFVWLEKHGYPGLVKKLDQSLRDHSYTEQTWNTLTSHTLNQLWSSYVINPTL